MYLHMQILESATLYLLLTFDFEVLQIFGPEHTLSAYGLINYN